MTVVAPNASDTEITEVILANLRRQGVEAPEQYLEGAEYVFSLRCEPTVNHTGELLDVMVIFRTYRKLPPYVCRCIAQAIREESLDEHTILNVHFGNYVSFMDRHYSLHHNFADEHPLGLNNCFFKTHQTITHDDLRFRSRAEITIYDELKRRNVLFFPNAGAVLGTTGTEFGAKVEKREPDFLVCFKGKWGILEVNGDDFHSGVIQTAKDHDRARRFQHYGLYFVQAYAYDRCKNRPSDVVDEFLLLLERHR